MTIEQKAEPDIGFWFDKEQYLVRVKDGLRKDQLVMASFELLQRAIRAEIKESQP